MTQNLAIDWDVKATLLPDNKPTKGVESINNGVIQLLCIIEPGVS